MWFQSVVMFSLLLISRICCFNWLRQNLPRSIQLSIGIYANSWCNGIWSCLTLLTVIYSMRSCFTKQEDGHVDEMLIPEADNHLPSYQYKHHVNNYCTVAWYINRVTCIPCYRLRNAFWRYWIPLWTGHMQ